LFLGILLTSILAAGLVTFGAVILTDISPVMAGLLYAGTAGVLGLVSGVAAMVISRRTKSEKKAKSEQLSRHRGMKHPQ
jgi:hypothetical protein